MNDLTLDSNIENITLLDDLTKDSFAEILLDNTFAVFKSTNELIYLIYTTKDKSIISYSIIENKKINEIIKAHENYITNIRYFLDKINKRDLILTISASDNNLKLWNINNYECLLNLKNINKRGEINSACFLNHNDQNYIITSNYTIYNDPIKVYDFNGKLIKEINDSNYRTIFIDTYYDNQLSKNFILTSNKGFVTSYDYGNNKVYYKYSDEENKIDYCSLIIHSSENNDIIKLIASSDDGCIRIWNFHSGKILKKIKVQNKYVYGICLWNNDILLVGSGDKTIKVVDLKEGKIINNLVGHKDDVISLKTIIHPKYGKCLISQGNGEDQIKIWIIKNK